MIHRTKKRFGQHFLHSQTVIDRIIHAIKIQLSDHLIEIGPGDGALTDALAPLAQRLDLIEIDRDLIPLLTARYTQSPHVHIHEADALTVDYATFATDNDRVKPLRIVGNLPYNISTPLLFHCFQFATIIKDMHFMLQKEVVDRLCAPARSCDFGRLSVMAQYHVKAESLFIVDKSAFSPPPRVQSAIVRLTPHTTLPFPANNYELFAHVVQTAFNQRRKTLKNALKTLISPTVMSLSGLDFSLRPEQLEIKDYVHLSNCLYDSNKMSP